MPGRSFPIYPVDGTRARMGAESGTPPEMVLRRLCDWAVAGGFPDGAFVTSVGERISPLDLLTAVRVVIGNGQATIGNSIIYMSPPMAGHQLAGAPLTAHNVLKFCAHTNTLPPPSVLGRLKRFLAARDRGKHVVPPECSDADEHAARQYAYRDAIDGLNTLARISPDLKARTRATGHAMPKTRRSISTIGGRNQRRRAIVCKRISANAVTRFFRRIWTRSISSGESS